MQAFKTIDDYIRHFPKEVAERLETIRALIHKLAPKAEEVISYSMPAFKLNGRILIYFAGFKNHIGMYPFVSQMGLTKEELAAYKTSGRGTIQFQHTQKLPLSLIKKMVMYKIGENKAREALGKKK